MLSVVHASGTPKTSVQVLVTVKGPNCEGPPMAREAGAPRLASTMYSMSVDSTPSGWVFRLKVQVHLVSASSHTRFRSSMAHASEKTGVRLVGVVARTEAGVAAGVVRTVIVVGRSVIVVVSAGPSTVVIVVRVEIVASAVVAANATRCEEYIMKAIKVIRLIFGNSG